MNQVAVMPTSPSRFRGPLPLPPEGRRGAFLAFAGMTTTKG
jgi:hypothetical protein